MAFSINIEKRRFTPQSGDTIPYINTLDSAMYTIDNAAPLATLTIQLHPTPQEGQLVFVSVRSAITQIIFTANGILMRGMVGNLPSNGVLAWMFDEASGSWFSFLPSPAQPIMIPIQATSFNPANAQTLFFGSLPKAPTTTAGANKIFVRDNYTIKRVELYSFSTTAGSNQGWTLFIRKNNLTDTAVATVGLATNERVFSKTDLAITLVKDEYVECKLVNPTWGTLPVGTVLAGHLYLE